MSPRHAGPPPVPNRQGSSNSFLGQSREQASGPFSRVAVVDRLPADTASEITVTAEPDERTALAEMDGLEQVDRLDGRFRLMRYGGSVHVTGEVEAEVVQICVVTLEPFTAIMREPVDVRFAPEAEVEALEAAMARHGAEMSENTLDTVDVPDPIIDGRIDLGALAAEFLTLGIDPHPRKPGAEFVTQAGQADAEAAPNVSPFAVLRARVEKS